MAGFPEDGRSVRAVLEDLEARRSTLLDYRRAPVLGLAGTAPAGVGLRAMARFAEANPNNVGWHLAGAGGPFGATRQLEVDVIAMLADLIGTGSSDVTGYLTSGGAESNLMALWMARNVLAERGRDPVAVLAGRSAHTSIEKACDVIGVGTGRWLQCTRPDCTAVRSMRPAGAVPERGARAHLHVPSPDGVGLSLVDLDAEYRLDPRDLDRRISALFAIGIARIAVVATVGSSSTGSSDVIGDIGTVIAAARRRVPTARFFVHVDAAMGGLVTPFLDSAERFAFGFDLAGPDGRPIVDSVSIDLHKAGLAPYPGGVFLARAAHRDAVEIRRHYQPGAAEYTISGSRPGAAAAADWALLVRFGRNGQRRSPGYADLARRSQRLVELARSRLVGMGAIVVGSPDINILAAGFPATRFEPRSVDATAARYLMSRILVSPSNDECPDWAYRFCFLPHVRRADVLAALDEFEAAALPVAG